MFVHSPHGIRVTGTEARRMPPLDTLGLVAYTAFFIIVTLVTMRRPALGASVLVLVTPFAYYQEVLGETLTLPKVCLLAVLLGLAAYRNAFASLASGAPWRIISAGVLVIAAILVSFVHAAYTAPVIREALKALEYLLIFCAVAAAYRLEPDRRVFAFALCATAIAVSVLALTQEIIGAPSVLLVNGHTLPRIAGPLEGPNQLAGYFDVVIPFALAFVVRERLGIARTALFFAIFADILTFSRGGLFGAAAGIVVLFAVARTWRDAVAPIAGGIIAGLAVTFTWGMVADSLGMLRWWNYQSAYAGGVGTRPELWRAAIALWKQHPIFGVGAGNFELDIPLTGLRGVRTHANSLYFQALVEGGIFLFGATLWLVYTSIATFVRERKESPFVLAALCASIALASHQVVDLLTFYPKVGAEWWIVMALGAAEMSVPVRTQQAACA
jgi:putative inorganic carbon (HCO3(-)) transporter